MNKKNSPPHLASKPKRRLIPTKDGILHWLSEHCNGFEIDKCQIWDDLSVSVEDHVSFKKKNIKYFPLNFKEVSGSFYITNNKLWTLEGCPQTVGDNFDCRNNKLTSLQGAPQEIFGDFNCSYNQIITLEKSPQKIAGYFNCNHNQLTTLEGGPCVVKEHYFCNNNSLKSLKGVPQKEITHLDCSTNQLTNLEFIPTNISYQLSASYNPLTSLKFMPQYIENQLILIVCPELKAEEFFKINTVFGLECKIIFSAALEKDFPGCYQGGYVDSIREINVEHFNELRKIYQQKIVLDKEVPLSVGRSSAKTHKI